MNMHKDRLSRIEEALTRIFPIQDAQADRLVYESARYSLLAGGKRVRPSLLLEFAKLFDVNEEDAMAFACALECIHTYSLIHDDMPCMDDDDMRRNRPTNHKVYGEAIALLAGDALLNRAFELLLSSIKDKKTADAAAYIADCAGVHGMIGGQCIDLVYEDQDIPSELLMEMHQKKTGALIRAACVGGAMLGTDDQNILHYAEQYAVELGLAFQIIDDILDVEGNVADLGKNIGMDAQQGKNTFVTIFGIDKAKEMAQIHTQRAQQALQQLPHSSFLADYTLALLKRNH